MISQSDVRWAYRYYLGRDPESTGAIDFYVEATEGHLETLMGALFESPEAKIWAGVPSPHGEFCLWRPNAKKVMVLGNCIGPNLGRAIAAGANTSVFAIDILNFLDKQYTVLPYLDEADFILSPNFGIDFGELAGGELRRRFGDKVAFYELVYFSGVHPDLTYLGARGSRVISPLGDYHSKTVVRSFISGYDWRTCQGIFKQELENSAGQTHAYQQSVEEFFKREHDAHVKIGSWLFETIRKKPLLYTINHPTSDVLIKIAHIACTHFGLDYQATIPIVMPNDMANNVTWPVHASVAENVGLTYHTPDVFWVNRYMMDLEEFIWRSFRMYSFYDGEEIADAAKERNLAPF